MKDGFCDVQKEPDLISLTEIERQSMRYKSAKVEDNSHPDMRVYGLFQGGQQSYTDFKVFDARLLQAGGVHVIQAFFSTELSEEIQIKGRCARQGAEGSFR